MNLLVIGKFAGVSHSCKRISVTGTIVSDQTFQFELVSSVRILRGKENYRQLAEQLSLICRIVVDEEEHEYAVVDVSPEGVGLVGWPEIARDSVVPIEFDSASGVIKCKAEVRYCRLTKDKAAYRLGLRLEFDDRISRGRWIQLFSEKAA
ncbi:MAG: PilZ domain-containing protein [Armatimonadetes bacterium]|nr:PilZ domain-containing protein [Armatimonadota bacterium]